MSGGNYFPNEQFIVFGPIFGFADPLFGNGRFVASNRKDALAIVSNILGELGATSKQNALDFLEGKPTKPNLWAGLHFYGKSNMFKTCRIYLLSPTPEYIK